MNFIYKIPITNSTIPSFKILFFGFFINNFSVFPLPPIKTQQKTVAYLDQISSKIEQIKTLQSKKMQSLKELKASLLDKAFRGELL